MAKLRAGAMTTAEQQTIAVTGANGWVGGAVCRALDRDGVIVRPLARQPGARGRMLDLLAPAEDSSWRKALEGAHVVIHCAAHVHRPIETAAEAERFHAVNIEGTRRLLYAARAAGIGQFVFVSTSAVYDWNAAAMRGTVSETSALGPTTAYGQSKLEAETAVRESGLSWSIARLGTVFGAGDHANFQRLAQALRRRRFVRPSQADARKSVISVELAGELLAAMATRTDLHGTTLNVALPEAPSLGEICEAFCRCCGFPRPPAWPIAALRLVAAVGDGLRVAGVHAPLTSETLRKLTTSTVLDVMQMQSSWPEREWPSFAQVLAASAAYYRQC